MFKNRSDLLKAVMTGMSALNSIIKQSNYTTLITLPKNKAGMTEIEINDYAGLYCIICRYKGDIDTEYSYTINKGLSTSTGQNINFQAMQLSKRSPVYMKFKNTLDNIKQINN